MPEEVLIPDSATHDVATFDILVNENKIDPGYQILSISIGRELNKIPTAKIVLRDGDAAERDFEISNQDDFVPGNKIKIKIGRDGTNSQIFSGVIIRHAIKIRENGNGELHIECRDQAILMTIGRHSRYFEDVKDSDVFDQLVKGYKPLKSDVETTKLKHKELVQHHISDWDFLLMRAEANSMLVNVDQGVIKIAKPSTQPDPVAQITYGISVLEFEAEMDGRTQWKKVKAVSWDYSNQNLFEADTTSAPFTDNGNVNASDLAEAFSPDEYQLHHSGHLLEQELQDWVDGTMLRSRLSKIRGRAKFFGLTGINPGDLIQLEGVGNRFRGKVFVTAVRQDIGNGMWDTHVQFGFDQRQYSYLHEDIQDAAAAGLVGSIKGLQIGVVVQLQNDPDGEHRILVKVPVIDNDARGTWMRVASLDAGNDRGAFFRPEINDEVIVGFINEDPRDAVVLGMLNSSAKPAPITAQDSNNEKGFTTRSKMHLSFNDSSKTITIDTPAGNSIVLDENGTKIDIKDQNSNEITLDSSGITLNSPMSIEIKAGMDLTLSAGATLSIGGATLSIKADGNVSVEGAMAKLAGQGITEITGGLVKIN